MNELRRLQKELDEKSSRDEYARQLEATLVMDESPVVVFNPSLSPVDISSTPALPIAVENDVANFGQREDSTFLMAKDIPMATFPVESVSAIPLETYTVESEIDESHVPFSEVPIFKDPPAIEMATPSSWQMATPILSPSTVLSATSPTSSLKDI